MVAYLTKSDASEGFHQVIDFLNGSYLKYALTVNPNIYVSCIKQFWNTVAIKQVNDITGLQALVDKKKVVVTEAAIRENVVGFKLDYFKGMSYDDIRPIFEAKFNSNVDFFLKTKEQMEEEESRALQIINKTLAEKAVKRRKLNEEVEDLKRHLEIMPDEDDDVHTEATPLTRKNFDREDLEALWNLVKERFSTSKPKNFFDDFLLTTLGVMFEKPDALAQVWKNQRTIHGQAKVKSWNLELCGVHIITFTTTQLILFMEKRYPLSRFTLDQMLNVVRLQVEEESEVSLELLRFTRQQHQEGQLE
nr:hypothetical protein [Tanacetum cinerariifolium]